MSVVCSVVLSADTGWEGRDFTTASLRVGVLIAIS